MLFLFVGVSGIAGEVKKCLKYFCGELLDCFAALAMTNEAGLYIYYMYKYLKKFFIHSNNLRS